MTFDKDDDYTLTPEEEQLARDAADSRMAVLRERARIRQGLNGNEQKALRRWFLVMFNAPCMKIPPGMPGLSAFEQAPVVPEEPLPADFALYAQEMDHVQSAVLAEIAVIKKALASVPPDSGTRQNRLDEAARRANEWLETINLKDTDGTIKPGKKPGPFARYFWMNPGDYTLAERAEIYEKYRAKGGPAFMGHPRTPPVIQEHLYSQLANNPPLADAGKDLLVLLKRGNAPEETRSRFENIFEKILEADRYFTPESKKDREAAVDAARIRREMRENGCYAGPVEPPREPPAPPDITAVRAELAAVAEFFSPLLSLNTPFAIRFKDFADLANRRLKEIEEGIRS
jgi:hypothetical protein